MHLRRILYLEKLSQNFRIEFLRIESETPIFKKAKVADIALFTMLTTLTKKFIFFASIQKINRKIYSQKRFVFF